MPDIYWNKAFLLATCLLFQAAGSGLAQLKRAPDWVSQIPVTGDAYYGLGIADAKSNLNYRTQARKMALKEITEKIYVSINTTSELTLKYEDEEVEYLLDETVALESSNFLSGHQKVDQWTDKRSDKYYVLYRLDRLTYLENRRTYFSRLDEMIRLIRAEADASFTKGEWVRGINKLVDSFMRLYEEMKKPIEPEYLISLQKKHLSTIYELEKQLGRIEFNVVDAYRFRVEAGKPLVISDFVVNRVTGTPLSWLNTSLKVLKGDVFNYTFDPNKKKNELTIYGFFPEEKSCLVQLEVHMPLPEEVREALDASIRNKLISKPINLRFEPYTIAFESNELDTKREENGQPLTGFLQHITQDLGLIETEEQKAHYKVLVSSHSRIVKKHRGIFTSEFEGQVAVVRTADNREVYRFKLPDVTRQSARAQTALQEAFEQSIHKTDEFLVTFVTFLCSLQGL